MGSGLYSDIDDWLENADEPEIDKDVRNEGNIPSGNPKQESRPQQGGNIQSEDPRPQEPQQEGNIDPQESNRPESPDRQPIDPEGQDEETSRRGNIPVSDQAPDPPQHKGNIQPSQFDPERGELSDNIEADDENQPQEPRTRRNIRPDEENRPENPNRVGPEAQDDATPSETERRSRGPREDAAPQSPNRRTIDLREAATPGSPSRMGNISSEDSRPSSPSKRGNINPTEEPPSTNPMEDADIDVNAEERPPEAETEGDIPVEDNPPQEPQREGNIPEETEEDVRPSAPNPDENIQAQEDARPQSPDVEGNIPEKVEEDPEPQSPNLEGNIPEKTEEDPEPPAPNRSGNIPEEVEEDVRPPSPQRQGNIPEQVEEDPEPQDPSRSGNISPTEESEPEEPQREDNINEEDRRPQEPNRDGFIDPTEESEPEEPQREDNINEADRRPQEPDRDGFISGTEDSEPEEPQREDNINEADRRPQEPDRDGFIEGTEDSEPEEPSRTGNIDPQSAETTDGVGGETPDEPDRDGAIDPRDDENTDDIGGEQIEEPRRSGNIDVEDDQPQDAQNEGNIDVDDEPPTDFNTQARENDFEDRNRTIRLQQFSDLWKQGRSDLPLGDSPIPRSGFSVPNVGVEEPFILRKPEAGGGSSAIANVKQGDSRTAPIGSAAEDTVRISKFFATGKGLTYNIKQQFLQSQNPRSRTRIYDPTSPIQTAASGMAVRPGQGITRHLGADSGPLGIVGEAAEGIGDAFGLNIPSSSRYIDELNEEATDTEWGEMRGSLFWLSPVATQPLPEVTGDGARTIVRNIRSGNVRNIKPLYSTEEQSELSEFAASQLASRGGIGNGYLFTNTYDPQGGPNSEAQEENDNYHPSAPYIDNPEFVNSRASPDALSYVEPQFLFDYTELLDKTEDERDNQGSFFPYFNDEGSPSQDNVVDGDGNVQAQIQNDSASQVYYENRAFVDRDVIPLHRGVPQQEVSYGLPNYSIQDEDGNKTKRIDWINRLEPIIGQDADPEQETFGGEGRHQDIIPFKFYDIPNSGLIVFRAFLEGISDNLSPEWSQQDYAGRPEQAHIYGGYTNTISFSFQAVPFSEEEFEAIWEKVNYLKGLTTPAEYSQATGGGDYMTPPFMRLTIGDLFNDVFGYMNSLTISFNDDVEWEIDQDIGRLPRAIEVDVDWQVIEKRPPVALQKYYDAPFIDEVENPTREAPEPRPEVPLPTQDSPAESPGVDTDRAIEQSTDAP